jgi:hypothetical protein
MNGITFKNIQLTLAAAVFSFAFAKAQTAQSTINQDERITELLDLKSSLEKEGKLTDRYKIQLYSGSLNTASSTLKKYRHRVGTWSSSIKHETPNYKVWIGSFRNRREADRALMEIKKDFPSAFIFKPDGRD